MHGWPGALVIIAVTMAVVIAIVVGGNWVLGVLKKRNSIKIHADQRHADLRRTHPAWWDRAKKRHA